MLSQAWNITNLFWKSQPLRYTRFEYVQTFGNNHVKFDIGFALWVRTTAERRSTLELKLHEIFVTAKNVPEQLIF